MSGLAGNPECIGSRRWAGKRIVVGFMRSTWRFGARAGAVSWAGKGRDEPEGVDGGSGARNLMAINLAIARFRLRLTREKSLTKTVAQAWKQLENRKQRNVN